MWFICRWPLSVFAQAPAWSIGWQKCTRSISVIKNKREKQTKGNRWAEEREREKEKLKVLSGVSVEIVREEDPRQPCRLRDTGWPLATAACSFCSDLSVRNRFYFSLYNSFWQTKLTRLVTCLFYSGFPTRYFSFSWQLASELLSKARLLLGYSLVLASKKLRFFLLYYMRSN